MKTKYLIPCVLLFSLTSFAQTPAVKVEYDKFTDRTTIALNDMALAQGAIGSLPGAHVTKHPELRLTLIHSYNGQAKTESPGLPETLAVMSSNQRLGLARPPRALFIIDGLKIHVPTEWSKDSDDKHDSKNVRIEIAYDLLEQIASAKRVEGRLGIVEFHLAKWHQDLIRQFITAVTSPSSTSIIRNDFPRNAAVSKVIRPRRCYGLPETVVGVDLNCG